MAQAHLASATNVTLLGFGACVLYSSDLNYKDEYENKSVQS